MLSARVRFFWDGKKIRENVEVTIEGNEVREGLDKSDYFIEGDFILLPAFFNAHAHLPMIVFKGVFEDLSFHDWLANIWEHEKRWDFRFLYPAALLSLAENVANGSPQVVSMYFDWLAEAKAAELLNARVWTGPILGFPFDHLIARLTMPKPSKNVVPTVFLHSLYAIKEGALERAREFVEKGYPLQIHVSETREEVIRVRKTYGDYPVRILEREGVLGKSTMIVHAGWLTKDELSIISRRGGILVHCPTSNMKLATHGFFPWREAKELGVKVRLGTDSQASNNTQDIFFEMRTALLLAKNNYWDAAVVGVSDALNAAVGDGWMLVDISSLRYYPQLSRNILANLVFNGSGTDVKYVYFNDALIYPFPERVEKRLEWARKTISKFLDRWL